MKFCGLTRAEDVDRAVELGAAYLGFVFAESPRRVTVDRVRMIAGDVDGDILRVGVFDGGSLPQVDDAVQRASLTVVQLHDPGLVQHADELRRRLGVKIWCALPVTDGTLPGNAVEVASQVDAIVLDTRVGKRIGGTGVPFDWAGVAAQLPPLRALAKIVVAGGLRAENVVQAITLLQPDIVDVSSGVEAQPGIKDAGRMRAFALNARGAMFR